jgi:hypothetical protein
MGQSISDDSKGLLGERAIGIARIAGVSGESGT